MTPQEHIPLTTLTTLRVGGAARFVSRCSSEAEIREALAFASDHQIPWYVLGEGSNVLAQDDGYPGLIIVNAIPGLSFEEEADRTRVTAGAGISWDVLVEEVTARGLWGMENLAGIPGFVGAAPVQNIGAYGAELKDIFLSADVLDTKRGERVQMDASACAFGYRDSRFKHDSSLIILSVTFTLSTIGAPKITYSDLRVAQETGKDLSTPVAIARVVREIRKGKFPDRTTHGTAGSFFKNPIISEDRYNELVQHYGPVPQFPHPRGVKIPLAFVLDKILGLRGYRDGKVWLFGAQPLVLVVDDGGQSSDVERLATFIEREVQEKTGITIEREVRTLSTKEN